MVKPVIDKSFKKPIKYEIESIIIYNGEIYLKIGEEGKRHKWIKFSMASCYSEELRKMKLI